MLLYHFTLTMTEAVVLQIQNLVYLLVLTELKVKTVIITGVMTNICVRSTAHDAFFHGYNVIVPEDTCRASCQREQDSSLCDIRTCYGLVVPSSKLLDLMAAK